MRKGMWPVAALVLLLSFGGALAVRAAGTTVSIVDGSGDPTTTWKFDPANITVAAGSTVTWKNTGQQPHTITADDGSFSSDYVSPGGTWQHTFATAGTYAYHCTPHPWMKAVVHVTGGPAPAPAPVPTPTTQAGAPSTPTTAAPARTAAAAASSTTTAPAPGASTTTSTAPAAAGGTTTTTATAAATGGASSAAPPTDNSTTTSTAAAAQQAAAGSRSHGAGHKTDTPLVVLAGVGTLLLILLTASLLGSKS